MADQYDEDGYNEDGYQQDGQYNAKPKLGNNLTIWGNSRTMNLNHLVLTNVQNSPYFKVRLFELKTYHEVVDEIYYKVGHLEPWERGTRKTAGQTGMCGGVRGVGAGGVVSTSFCILFKLFTLKLTRKQVNGLLNHTDSPFIRGLGVMYVRYTQPPPDLWDWFESYLDDDEEIDVKAGGGCVMTIGSMIKTVLTKLDWFSTLFPRIPVPTQKIIDANLADHEAKNSRGSKQSDYYNEAVKSDRTYETDSHKRAHSRSRERSHQRSDSRTVERRSSHHRSVSRDRHASRSRDYHRSGSRDDRSVRSSDSKRSRRSRSRDRLSSSKRDRQSRDHDRRNRSRSRERSHHHRR